MSMWLSSANQVMGAARGQVSAAAKRQLALTQAEAARQMIDFWSIADSARRKKRRR